MSKFGVEICSVNLEPKFNIDIRSEYSESTIGVIHIRSLHVKSKIGVYSESTLNVDI